LSRSQAEAISTRQRLVAEAWVRLSQQPDWRVVTEFLTTLRDADIQNLGPQRTKSERAFVAGRLQALQALLSRPDLAVRTLQRNPLMPEALGDPYEPPPNTNSPMGRTG
jgi:hypothetical protein